MMHELLIQGDGDMVEIVPADETAIIVVADVPFWESDKVRCLSGKVWEEDEFMDVAGFLFQTGQADDEEA